jgi:small-conductance mechanosensitive channel
MSDDIVKLLQQVGEGAYVGAVSKDRKTAREASARIKQLEAANLQQSLITVDHLSRIEKLEAALRQIVDCCTLPAQNDCEMREIARKALEGKDE